MIQILEKNLETPVRDTKFFLKMFFCLATLTLQHFPSRMAFGKHSHLRPAGGAVASFWYDRKGNRNNCYRF